MQRPAPRQLALLALGLALALGWPFALPAATRAAGARGVAAALAALGVLSLAATRAALPRELRLGAAAQLALLGLAATAAATGSEAALRLVPAWVQLALARVLERSLRDGPSLIERVVFWIQPHAPDFIRPYCRTETKLWAGLFAANGCVLVALALFAPAPAWRAFAGAGVWLATAAFALADFAVRKLTFRIYGDGPLDRLLARAFPPDATEMARRANAYRVAKRVSLGRDPRTGAPLPRH